MHGPTELVRWLSVTPTVDTSAYAAGDLIGGKLTVDLAGFRPTPHLLLQAVTLVDRAGQAADIDVVLFDSNPAATTFTDQAAFAPADADLAKMLPPVSVASWATFSGSALGSAGHLAIPVRVPWRDTATPALYAALVSRGTPTFAAAGDLSLRLGFVAL